MKIKIRHRRVVLNNGSKIILIPMNGSTSVGISILIGTGSRFENSRNNGISHFLEHIVFKGTKSYPNQLLISEGIEGVGGILNGYTSSQVTNYWAKITPDHFGTAFDILSDLVMFPLIRSEDVDTEKGVIVEEIRMKNDNPSDEIYELAQKSLWGNGGLGLPVLGRETTIRTLKRNVLENYHQQHYTPSSIVISVAGSFDTSKVLNIIQTKIINPGKKRPASLMTPQFNKGSFILKVKETAQAHLAFSYPAFPFSSSLRYVLDVLSSILGRGMSSRLFRNVRDKGLAYSVHCAADYLVDTGGFVTYAGVEKERLSLAIKTILAEFSKIADEKVTKSELGKSKEKIVGSFIFSLEDPIKVSEYFGYQEAVFGKVEMPIDYLNNINRVSSLEIKELGQKLFSPKNLSFSAISPFSKDKFHKLLQY